MVEEQPEHGPTVILTTDTNDGHTVTFRVNRNYPDEALVRAARERRGEEMLKFAELFVHVRVVDYVGKTQASSFFTLDAEQAIALADTIYASLQDSIELLGVKDE